MTNRHNLGTVISFEFIRTIKKPSFWVATLAFPLFIVGLFGLIFYSNNQASKKSEELAKEKISIIYQDDSGIVSPEITSQLEARKVTDKQQAIADVRAQKIDAFFYYPKEISKESIEVYGKDTGLFNNNKYTAAAQNILSLSATNAVGNPDLVTIIKGKLPTKFTAYKENGEEAAGWLAAVPPLIFLVMFYLAIVMLGNNLLNSTIEEKENRVTEMILTTINPTNLIMGKMIATFLAGIVQAIVIITPIVIAYFVMRQGGGAGQGLPDAAMLQGLVIEPIPMLIGALIFLGGILLFAGSLMTIGAIMPTAKEASQWFTVVLLPMFIPFYIISFILSDPNSFLVRAFTYFPLTSPVTSMLRNAFGSMNAIEGVIVTAILIALGAIIIRLAVHLFRYGAMQYDSKLSLKGIFRK